MLLIGYENHKIELFVELGDNKFHLIHSLIGHEDWITDIDVCSIENDSGLMIATSSQDNYIRLWKMSSNLTNRKEDLLNVSKLIDEDSIETVAKIEEEESRVTQSSNEDDEEDQVGKESNDDELKLKSSLFAIKSKKLNKYVKYSLNLESVLYGHEDWIYTVKFHPKFPDGTQPMILMSASMDKTLVVWRYDEQNSIWIDAV
jgi:elongator complex protein 2